MERGYDASLGDYDKRTPLHLAASENHIDALRFLILEAKVQDVSPLDRWSNTPLDDAIRCKHQEAAAFLSAAQHEKGFPPEVATWEEESGIHDDFIDEYEAGLEAEAEEESDGESSDDDEADEAEAPEGI